MNTSPFRVPILLFLFFGLCPPSGAEIYRWIGADGKVHFGDKPPEGKETQQAEPFQTKAAVSFMGDGMLAKTAKATKVRMFVTQNCPYCKKAKALLRQRHTPFEELDIEASPSAKAEHRSLGGNGVPLILVGKERMNGFDAGQLESLLEGAGL